MEILDTTSKAVKIKIKMIKLQNRYHKIKKKLKRLKSTNEVIAQIEVLSHSQEDAIIKSNKRINKLQDVEVLEPIYPCSSSGLSSPDFKNRNIQLRDPNVENLDLLNDLVTAKPKSCNLCILTEDDLVDGLRVLLRLDGLFHPGRLISVLPPDIYD